MTEPDIETDQLCNWFLEQEPDVVLHWFHEVREGTRQAPEGFNWLLLAEISADIANRSNRRDREGKLSSPPDVGWAHVAIFVNTFLMREMRTYGKAYYSLHIVPIERREYACFTYEQRVLRTRIGFILRLGSVPDDPVLDIHLLAQSFLEDLTISPEEVLKQYAAGRETLSREQLQKLNRLQRNVELLRPLAERSLLPQELLPWYAIRERLHFS